MAEQVIAAGADALIVHARKAWLKGLSPKENRDIPPLDYPLVHQLKRDYPHVPIAINGGFATIESAQEQLSHLDGVMIGRAAYHDTDILLKVDPLLFGVEAPHASPFEVVEAYIPYVEAQLARGVRLADMTRHMLGLFVGMPGARAWRRHLATEAVKRGAGSEVLRDAMKLVSRQLAA
jgi:tRNA-dihydrouridine synthase A